MTDFKKFFTYVLHEYCEETCTAQDELFEIINKTDDEEELSDLFIDEGFLKWTPSEFVCLHDSVDEYQEGRVVDSDEQCVEQYWDNICERTETTLDDVLVFL